MTDSVTLLGIQCIRERERVRELKGEKDEGGGGANEQRKRKVEERKKEDEKEF